MRSIPALMLCLLMLAACSAPATKIYSLHLPEEKGQMTTPDTIIVIQALSPRYLAQPYIAYRSSPYQVDIAQYSKWDAAPVDTVRDNLRDALAGGSIRTTTAFSGDACLLKVTLKHFERLDRNGESFGNLIFDAELTSPEGKELLRTTIARLVRLPDRTFLSLAQGMSQALTEAVKELRPQIIASLVQKP